MLEQAKWFGVSSGNGNDGVSQLYPDYYVKTADPFRLAELAVISEFKAGAGQAWAKRNVEIDGEADYTIYASIDAPPCDDSDDGEYPELPEGMEWEDAEDGRNWSESNGVWLLLNIFPVDESDVADSGRPTYDSIEEAF